MFNIIKIILIVGIDWAMVKCLIWLRPKWNTPKIRKNLWLIFGAQMVISLIIIECHLVLGAFFHDYRMVTIRDYCASVLAMFYSVKFGFLVVQALLWLVERCRRRRAKPVSAALRRWSPYLGIALGLFGMALLLWAVVFERFNDKVYHQVIFIDDLPEAFDGFRIVQLSDLHAGSFYGHEEHLKNIVELVNAQKPELIVFTGDFVNNYANELLPLIPTLRQLQAPLGKIAILGNHDYGGYCHWDEAADSIDNHIALLKNIEAAGFHLLVNQSTILQKDSVSKIALIGVENWGARKRHPKLADLETALNGVRNIPCKILLSHDPSYWPVFVRKRGDINLTLSGHTHGMQMGFRIHNRNYGPGDLLYRYWSGLYCYDNSYLYINTGLGVGAFLGRLGMPPEITVIELRRPGLHQAP